MDSSWFAPVRDFMTRGLISVPLDAPLSEVQRTLDHHSVSAVPVVDQQGMLSGILSTKDLLRAARIEMSGLGEARPSGLPLRVASDLMRTPVITISETAPVGRAAAEMLSHRIHRLIVVQEGKPSGVISTRDAMRAIVVERVKTPLSQVMTREVETIDQDDPVDAAVERLDDANVRGLVVLDGKWPIGVFTHDEALRASALPASMRKIPVERVMSYETVCLDVSTPVDRVANYARQMRVRRILAVEQHHLRGIATGFDLLRVMTGA
jgi:acetoin utilization protein AcuB